MKRKRLLAFFVTLVVTFLLADTYSAHSASTMPASKSRIQKDKLLGVKGFCLADEISNLFDDSLNCAFGLFEEEAEICPSQKEEHGDYNCQNVLTIWPRLRKSYTYPRIQVPRDVGEKIKKSLPKSAKHMIEKLTVQDVGFVTFSLSRKWLTKSIHNMLKHGIDTWTPKLPVQRVIVNQPSLDGDIQVGFFRGLAIQQMLIRMLMYCKVNAWSEVSYTSSQHNLSMKASSEARGILKKWFSITGRRGGEVVIDVEDKPPFILAKGDFENSYRDLETLRYLFEVKRADWVVYVTPMQQQEYIEMCFTAAKHEKWTPPDKKWEWIPDGTSYAGYRTCTIEPKNLVALLNKVRARCGVVAQGKDACLLKYNAEAIFNCTLVYTLLKSHRMANCTFTFDEMISEEGNTFVCLLNTLAEICRITHSSCKEIAELKKASKLILDIVEGSREREEHALEVHLLEFTEVLEESCSSLSPHILCEYVYDLSKKFTSYHFSVCKVGAVAETSTLLLCEATKVVMEQCFVILGITQVCSFRAVSLVLALGASAKPPMDVNVPVAVEVDAECDKKRKELEDRCITPCLVSVARDPPRNSRFELFSIRPFIKSDKFEKGKMFGLISVSDNYGLLSDGVCNLFEPDFAYVPLFNYEWCHSINMHNNGYVYLGNPSYRHAVAFSSSIDIRMEIYVTSHDKDECYELCNRKFKLDLLNIWGQNSRSKCGCFDVNGEDGVTRMHYILLKDAVDAALEVRFEKNAGETRGREVRGEIYAFYGSDILDEIRDGMKACYWSLLFRADEPFALEGDKIPLRKCMLAVPKNAPLKFKAYLVDVESKEFILDDICELNSLTNGSNEVRIEGLTGTLILKADWTYEGQYL